MRLNIALFGGTFDPIHTGHWKVADAAVRALGLDRVLFIPTGTPPHKHSDQLTPFHHRFAMVTLACAGRAEFVPSLLEAPKPDGKPHYSIDTVRRVRKTLGTRDRLFFLLGADAFLDLPHWRASRSLLDLANFVVVSRSGFSSDQIRTVIPGHMIRAAARGRIERGIPLRRTTVWILPGVRVPFASTNIREAIRRGRKLSGYVPPLVEEYILKEGLYRRHQAGRAAE